MMSAEKPEGDFGEESEAYDEGGIPDDHGATVPEDRQEGEGEDERLGNDVDALRQHAAGGYGGGELRDDWDLTNEKSDEKNTVEAADSKEFTVKLQKLPGMRLGLECVQYAGELVVQGIAEGMVADDWNQKNPYNALKEGDVVRQVNSIRGDPQKMLNELRSGLVMLIKVEHCARQVPQNKEAPSDSLATMKRSGGALLRFHQRMELEALAMDQAFAMGAISRRHERPNLDDKVWEAASAWSLESFMFFEEVPFLAAFGYSAKDKMTWEAGKPVPKLTLDLDEHFEQAGCTWYIIKCQLEVPVDGSEQMETLTWEAPRRLHHLRMELHDRMKFHMEDKFYTRVFGETPFARHMGLPGTTARLKAWLVTLANAMGKQEVPPMAAAITLLFLHTPLPSDGCESPTPEVPQEKPPRPSAILAI